MAENEVMLGYSASSNITFRGEIGTGISREEWNEMSEKEQDEVLVECLSELVDIYVMDE